MADQQGNGPVLLGGEDIRLIPVGHINSPFKKPSLKGGKDGIKHSGNTPPRREHDEDSENNHQTGIRRAVGRDRGLFPCRGHLLAPSAARGRPPGP